MKAAGPATGFEVGLYELLHRVAPGHVLEPIATDTERAWMVLPDGGPVLADLLEGDELVEAMAAALGRYAELQRLVAPHADELVPLGALDMRPACCPSGSSRRWRGRGDDRERLAGGLRPDVARWCDELAARRWRRASTTTTCIPTTCSRARPRAPTTGATAWSRTRSRRCSAGFLAPRFMGEHGPRLRDAYLDGFADLAPRAELVGTLELARRWR